MRGEGQETAMALRVVAGVEPTTAPDALLKTQVYDLLTSKPDPEMDKFEAETMLKTLGKHDKMTGRKENCINDPTCPIKFPVLALRTANEAMPWGRSTNAGSWQFSCIEVTTVAMGDTNDCPLPNSNEQT
jgi:hypothetical protein